ncbi:MAG: hypothetical protein K0U13_02270 [Chlamydiae bacterium]|nr:hypothetical protein [Chlamydiota bacterium]
MSKFSRLLRFRDKLVLLFTPKLSQEAQFKVQLARLLSQENVREHFLEDPKRRKLFFMALKEAAKEIGYKRFTQPDSEMTPIQAARFLTKLKGTSLLDNSRRLNFKAKRMQKEEEPVLHTILSHIERSPLVSGLEVDDHEPIVHQTRYSKLTISHISESGKVSYELFLNKTAPAFENASTPNQGVIFDTTDPKQTWLGSYCGDLGTPKRVLEQVLLILQAEGPVEILEKRTDFKVRILFTSLYNWREMEDICRQRDAIETLHGKTLKIGDEEVTLDLFYYNLNSIYRMPIPANTRAFLEDLNDFCLIRLLGIDPLDDLPDDFFEKQKRILEAIDHFRANRPQFDDPILDTLVQKQKPNGKALRGMDALLYLEEATHKLEVFHNKNCRNGVDRTTTAKAADKAQNALHRLTGETFLPGYNEHEKLFKALYSLYLMWEEPGINAALSLGVSSHTFFRKLFYLNPQHNRYLASWARLGST